LFSYPESNFVSGKDRIKIKADGSEWSKPISLDAVGNVNNFDVFNKETGTWYNFALYVHLGSDRFSKVHVVKLSPRYVIANRIPGRTLYVKAGDEPILQLKEGTINFHCNPRNFKNIRISYDGETWTPKFTIGDVGETYLKVFESVGPMGSSDESIKDSPMDLVKISNVLETQILYIAMTKEKKWPFKIVNKSSVEIKFNQKGCKNDRMLLPGETENFAWDDPSASQLALSVTVMERQRDYNIRELGQCKPLIYRGPGGEKSYLSVNVEADGPVILVKFKNYDVKASKGIFRLVRNSTQAIEEESEDEAYGDNLSVNNEAMSEASSNDFGVKEAKDETMMSFTLKLAGLGISLVGADLIEFMYVCGKGLEFRIQQSKLFQTLGFKLKWFQIDNCLFDYTHPILMYPAVVQKNEKELDEHPTLNIGIIKSNEGSGVDYYKYFGVLLQEMNIELGEELLEKIILFAQFDSIIPPPSPLLQDTDFQIPPLRNASVDTKLMYYELFQIHPIKLNVSFSRTESDSKSEGISAYNPLGPLLSILSMASGNISEAPLKFNSLLLEHPIVSSGTLKDRVIGHYTQQAIVQVHKILGSIDMLGNPVGLFNTMGEGVTDLFYEPYQGFVSDRPQDIGIGLAKV
jgi:vacuolar protein sorting-associated protein 13A/C